MSHQQTVPATTTTTDQGTSTTPPSSNYSSSSNSSNNNNNNNNNDENIQNGFYSISCLNCRKAHRSCNKQYPACSDCVERGHECIYNCPKKKGRKKGSRNQKTLVATSNNTTSASNSNSSNNQQQQHLATSSSSNKSPTHHASSSSSSSGDNNKNNSPTSTTNIPDAATTTAGNNDYTELLNLLSGGGSNSSSSPSLSTTQQLIRRIYQPYVRMQQHFLNDSIRRKTVDMFFEVIGMGYDIISRSKLEQLAFDYMDDNIEEDGIFAKNAGFHVNATRCSAKAMLFAMQAMGEQRMGNLELSQTAYMEARRQLAQSIDSIDNTYVKIAYGLLACYMAGEGDDITAHYYLNSLKRALEGPVTTNTAYLLLETGDISTPERQAKHFNTFMLKQKVCLDHNNPQDLNIWEGFISMYTAKTHESPPLSVQEVIRRPASTQLLAVIDLIITVMNNSSKLHHFTENQRRASSLYITMMNNSAKMAVLLTLGVQGGAILDNLADSVTALTDSDNFLLMPCSIIHYFAISMNYRVRQFSLVQSMIGKKLECGKSLVSIFDEPYEKHYFEMVLKDMKALSRLNTRYKRVEKCYGSLMNNLKAIIQWKSDKILEIIQNIGFISEHIGGDVHQNQSNNSYSVGGGGLMDRNQEPFTSAFGSTFKNSATTNSFNHYFNPTNQNLEIPTLTQNEQQLLDDLLGSSNDDEFLNFDMPDFTTH